MSKIFVDAFVITLPTFLAIFTFYLGVRVSLFCAELYKDIWYFLMVKSIEKERKKRSEKGTK